MDCTLMPSGKAEEMKNGIALSSASHAFLFYHDEEIIRNFQKHNDLRNEQISCLEADLQAQIERCQSIRTLLYDSQTTLCNETQHRLALERHLRLEQDRCKKSEEARLSQAKEFCEVQQQLGTLIMSNEMLKEEINHGTNVINSMALKLRTYESAADSLLPTKTTQTSESESVSPEESMSRPLVKDLDPCSNMDAK